MQFSDTVNKTGLIQSCEFWTRQGDGTITGTLLKQFTTRINSAFEKIIPLLLAYNNQIRWDDINNTDAPIGYVNLVANQNDYKITVDANSYDILTILKVRIHQSSSATPYIELKRVTSDDPDAGEILDPSVGASGVPWRFMELGNTIYLDPKPTYACTNGLEIFFGRQQQYFVSTDTTKKPGIPLPFHELLALYASLDWIMVNRTDDTNLITLLQGQINQKVNDLKSFINLRNPSRAKMTMKPISYL